MKKITVSLALSLMIIALLAGCKVSSSDTRSTSSTTYEYVVRRGPLLETVDISGRVVADEEREVRTLVAGVVEKVFVEEGDRVKKGDELLELEDEMYRLNYLKALQNYENARAEGTRFLLEQRKLELEMARRELERTKIYAPIDGVVVTVNVDEGEPVNSGKVIVSIVSVDSIHVEGAIDEVDYGKIEIGQRAMVMFESLNLSVPGTVSYISPVAHTSGGLNVFPLKVKIGKRRGMEKIVPGLSCDVKIIVVNKHDVLVIPVDALRKFGDEYFVRVKTDEGIEDRKISVGYIGDFVAEVISGLREGETLLIAKGGQSGSAKGSIKQGPAGRRINPFRILGR